MKRPIVRLVVCGALGAMVSLPAWFGLRRYEATARLRLDLKSPSTNGEFSSWDLGRYLRRTQDYVINHALVRISTSRDLVQGGLRASPTRLREQLRASVRYAREQEYTEGSEHHYCCILVDFSHEDRFTAEAVGHELLTEMMEYPEPCCPDCSCPPGAETLFVIDPITVHPTQRLPSFVLCGASLGLLAGIVWEMGRGRNE